MLPTHDDLDDLLVPRSGPHLSLYLPTHRKGPATRQDPIRLKNLLREARSRLEATGLSGPDAGQLTEPARALLDDAAFWRHRDHGLALFSAPAFFRGHDLPDPCEELLVVSERFHLKPLIPIFSGDGCFTLLALGLGQTRVFECRRGSIRAMEVEGMPSSLEEALPHREEEKSLQFHTGTGGTPSPAGGRRNAAFHGQGSGKDDEKERERTYCRQVDAALRRRIGESAHPLLLSALEPLQATYRQANRYPHLLVEGLTVNPEGERPQTLLERAWPLVRPHFERPRREAIEEYSRLAGAEPGRVAAKLERLVPAACNGRVATLFVAAGVRRWGRFDPPSGRLEVHGEATRGDGDLLDLAAMHTLAKGGSVYSLDPARVPGGGPAAAILRY